MSVSRQNAEGVYPAEFLAPSSVTQPSPLPANGSVASGDCSVAQNIVWLASYPKSGNTWLRALLQNLHEGPEAAPADINRLNDFASWESGAKRFARLLGKPINEATQLEIARLRPKVQAEIASSSSRPFLLKTHLCLGNCHGVPLVNLDATLAAIYIVRNPLDVAISYAHHSGTSIDSTIAVMAAPGAAARGRTALFEIQGSWSEHVASWLSLWNRPVLILRYEDLLGSPLRTVAALARFAGFDTSEAGLKAAIAKSSFQELCGQEAESGFRERPSTAKVFFREGRAGQWRDVLNTQQVAEIIRAHEPMMQRFGYLPPRAGVSLGLGRQGRKDTAGGATCR